MVDYILRLRSQGCRIVLVTGSPDFLVAPLADLLGTGGAQVGFGDEIRDIPGTGEVQVGFGDQIRVYKIRV